MMLKKETNGDGDTAGNNNNNNNWARVCDTCHEAACTVYCKADSAYLCSTCDTRIHAANRLASRHERLLVCEACENAPATFLCKADSASLCSACDATIHAANPLARRHQRVPILPVFGDGRMNEEYFGNTEDGEEKIEDETDSWLLLSNMGNSNKKDNYNNGMLFGGEEDEFLDVMEYNLNSFPENQYNIDDKNYGDESVVPVDCEDGAKYQFHNFELGFDFECSKSGYNFNGSTNHGVSSTEEEVSNSYTSQRAPKGTIDLFTSHSTSDEMSIMRDREARVLRYREKKKNRKFEKTIRYASRKAYAETRPRIKGRFAKRSSVDLMTFTESGYGVVPAGF